MTLQQLIYAVKIADTKSMNKAATELFDLPACSFQYNKRPGRRIADRDFYPHE